MLNKVILMGRIANDMELRQTNSGVSVLRLAIAVDRNFVRQGEERQTDFIDCVAWRQQAEFISKYFHKGSMINVVGSLQKRSWDDQNGNKRYSTEVIIDEVNFTGEKANSSPNTGGGGGYTSYTNPNASANDYSNPYSQPSGASDGFSPIVTDDDLPF